MGGDRTASRGVRPSRSNTTSVNDLAAYERRFRRAGLPLFIEDYSASEDMFTRATPLLALVFVGEMLGAIDLDWTWSAEPGRRGRRAGHPARRRSRSLNLLRGRPPLARPREVGVPELAAFVLLPAVLPLIFGGQLDQRAGHGRRQRRAARRSSTRWSATGCCSIVRWAAGRLVDQLRRSLVLLTRAMPLLLVFALVLFVNTELWQVFSSMPGAFLAWWSRCSCAAGSVFLVAGSRARWRALERAVGRGPGARPPPAGQRGDGDVREPGAPGAGGEPGGGRLLRRSSACSRSDAEVRESWIGSDGQRAAHRSICSASRCRSPRSCCACRAASPRSPGSTTRSPCSPTRPTARSSSTSSPSEMRDTFRARAEYLAARG